MPRTNLLIRPTVANVDQIFIVLSAKDPMIAYDTLYKLIFLSFYYHTQPLVIITKIDLLSFEEFEKLKENLEFLSKINVPLFFISQNDLELPQELSATLQGKVTTFAGPSGVGKSTLMNRFQTIQSFAVGAISERLKRGKHTTTTSTLLPIHWNTFLCDTPGFHAIDLPIIKDIFELLQGMPFLTDYFGKCKFNNCTHTNEPGCFFKTQLTNDLTLQKIYPFYLSIFNTIFGKGER